MSSTLGRMDEEWPTDPATEVGNGVVLPPPGSPTVIVVRRFVHIVPPPVHHTQGAKTIPGPVLTEPER
jgi:hypothetical protein